MLYISLPEPQEVRRLSFYLAMEEYVARHIDADDCFFMWRVAPSVIFGRNQQAESEVNLDYCRQHGIQVYRRKSGGGCVYADRDNVMLSYVTRGEQVNMAFHRFVGMLMLVFHKMGLQAVTTSRNDVLLDGRKLCGTACYQLPGRCIVHSTMLYDTDMNNMLSAITPGPDKLQAKGIQSVRQRITLLKDHTPLSLEQTMQLFRQTLCSGEAVLSEADVATIEQTEQGYLKNEFIYLM
ncbi:MAG: lipoate--protein ligase family protein [Prevotella sp.]|nr:lipoate--protein ligase family protein [Prevotella sp.]